MNRIRILSVLKAGAALAAMTAAAPLAAQETPEAGAGEEQEAAAANEAGDSEAEAAQEADIVVTARRRAESLIDVPIAVTAYSGEALENQGALDITDISDTTPNVTLETSRGTNTTLTAFIRGVGQQDPVAGFEQGVGIYLDDVYLNRPQAAVLDIYDVERIEVLRGPQGTLYGRNTVGGAVKYVTRRLSRDPELRVRGNVGTYGQLDGILSGSTPLGGGTLRIGGSLARLTRNGFGENLTTGEENYNRNIWAARVSAEVNNDRNVFFRLAADWVHDRSNARGGHRPIAGLLSGAPVLSNVFDTRGGLVDPRQDIEGYGISAFGEVELTEAVTVRSITAWRKDDSATPIDFDALPAVDVDVPAFYKNSQLSQELQLLLELGPLNGLIGGYFLDARARSTFDVRLFTTLAGLTGFTDSRIDTETFAVFGDFTYDLSDMLSVSVGGRYTWDTRKGQILRQNYLGGGSPVFGGAGVPLGAPGTNFRGSVESNRFTPRASISFKPSDGQNLYASYAQGFKGSGFDPRGAGVNAPDLNGNGVREDFEIAAFLSFDPEIVDSYEIGYKASLLDRRLNVALAAFRADYTDVQIPGSEACTINGLPSFCGTVTNAGKARFQGVEAEASAKLARSFARAGDALTLSGSLGYIDAEFREYVTNVAGVGPVDVAAFREIQNTPKWTASGTLAYDTPVGDGHLNFNTTVAYRSKTFQFEIPQPVLDQPGFALWDANIIYRSADDRWSVGLHGKNLTNKRYVTSGYPFLSADPVTGELRRDAQGRFISGLGREGVTTQYYGNPRQVFLSFGLKF